METAAAIRNYREAFGSHEDARVAYDFVIERLKALRRMEPENEPALGHDCIKLTK